MAYNSTGFDAYKQNSMNVTSTPKLVEMMYEGVLRFLAQAKKSATEDDIEKKVYWINRTISIFGEFVSILDYEKGGDVAHYLNGLYSHQIKTLSESLTFNGEKKQQSIDIIDSSINLVKELLEAWKEANKKTS